MWLRLVIGLGGTAIAFAIAGRRVWWLYRLISSGQPATGRTQDIGSRLLTQVREVIGQQRLLRWSVPGLAHAFTFWGFLILGLTIVEAYGALFDKDFHIPLIGRWGLVGVPGGLLRRRGARRSGHLRDPAPPAGPRRRSSARPASTARISARPGRSSA